MNESEEFRELEKLSTELTADMYLFCDRQGLLQFPSTPESDSRIAEEIRNYINKLYCGVNELRTNMSPEEVDDCISNNLEAKIRIDYLIERVEEKLGHFIFQMIVLPKIIETHLCADNTAVCTQEYHCKQSMNSEYEEECEEKYSQGDNKPFLVRPLRRRVLR